VAAWAGAVLGPAGLHAAVYGTAIDRGTPAYGSIVATGYRGYTLRLISDTGNISGIDVQTYGGGIFGQFIQRWLDDEEGNPTFPTSLGTAQNLTSNVNNFDSHVLPPGGNIANWIGVPPWEDNVITTSIPPFPPNDSHAAYGRGSFIKGAWGVVGPVQSAVQDIAYIVIPEGTEHATYVRGRVATANGVFDLGFVVPEPACIAIVGAVIAQACLMRGRTRRVMLSDTG
jgi:hypothetical protein